jgi:hypothetical protein
VEFQSPTLKHEILSREIVSSGGACQERRILSFLGRGAGRLPLRSENKFVASLGVYEGKIRREARS